MATSKSAKDTDAKKDESQCSQRQLQNEGFSSKISDEINCPICLDILVSPVTLVPCGHSFCRSCCLTEEDAALPKGGRNSYFKPTPNARRRRSSSANAHSASSSLLLFAKCPHCRQTVENTVPSRQLESLIDTLVTVPNLLFRNDDDREHFLKRKKAERAKKLRLKQQKELLQQQKEVSSRLRKRRRMESFSWEAGLSSTMTATTGSGTAVSRPATSSSNGSNTYWSPLPDNRREPSASLPPSSFSSSSSSSSTQNQYQEQVQSSRYQHQQVLPFSLPPNNGNTFGAVSNFDPMYAPLPPPYDFAASAPNLNLASPLVASMTTPISSSPLSFTAAAAAAPAMFRSAPNGISASDPICID